MKYVLPELRRVTTSYGGYEMSLSDLQRRKLDKRFRLLDVNGDGTLAKDDFKQLAQRVIDGYSEHVDAEIAVRLRNSYETLWRTLVCHG